MKFKLLLTLFLFSTPFYAIAQYAPAQDGLIEATANYEVIEKQQKCFKPWFEEISKPIKNLDQIKMSYAIALTCIDPCITAFDASFLAHQCYDWDKVLPILTGKSDVNTLLNAVFEQKLSRCSNQFLARSRKDGTLDGIYFDPETNACFDKFGDKYLNNTQNILHLVFGLYGGQVLGAKEIESTNAGPMVSGESKGFRRNNGALYSWNFRVDLGGGVHSAVEANHTSGGAYFTAKAQLEAAMYKTFGKSHCTPILGVLAQANSAVSVSADGYHPLDAEQLTLAAKGSVGMACSTFADSIVRIEVQGDLVRLSAYVLPVESYKPQWAYTHAGRQIDARLNIISDFMLYNTELGVGSFVLPQYSMMDWYIKIQAGYHTKTGVGGVDFEFHNYDIKSEKPKTMQTLYGGAFGGFVW